jgi:hypothetical protein
MSTKTPVSAPSASAATLSNQQKARDWTTVAVVLGSATAALSYAPSRSFLLSVHVGALTLYLAAAGLLYVCYAAAAKAAEWRGGGVSGILRSKEGGDFHSEQVEGLVDGYYGNFGEESRSEKGNTHQAHSKRGGGGRGRAGAGEAGAQRERERKARSRQSPECAP